MTFQAARALGAVLATLLTTGIAASTQAQPLAVPGGPGSAVRPLVATPNPLDLGVRRMGSTPVQQTLTVVNPTLQPISLSGWILEGAHASEFQVLAPSSLPIALQPGGSVHLDVRFSPAERGPRRARLLLEQSPHSHLQAQVGLGGTGIGPTGAEIFLNSGGVAFIGSAGEPFTADYGATGSSVAAHSPGTVANTADQALYQFFREGQAFGYALGLPDGFYEVTLHFVEPQHTSAGQRVFHLAMEGEMTLSAFDIHAVAGHNSAHAEKHVVLVRDGALEIILHALVGKALLAGIEVRSIPRPVAAPIAVDFGEVHPGDSVSMQVAIQNRGLHPASVTQLSMVPGVTGDSSDFKVTLGGSTYLGSTSAISYPLQLTIPPAATRLARFTYTPTLHQSNAFTVRLSGNFQTLDIPVSGTGGDVFLHPVIAVAPVNVDYDDDGSAVVHLDGTDSHTHEPGHSIVSWTWREHGQTISQLAEAWLPFPLGLHTVELEIGDTHSPPHTSTSDADFRVVPSSAVPGPLALYYDPAGSGLSHHQLLDAVPANADFAEVLPFALQVGNQGTLGGSPYSGNVMVRVLGALQVPSGGTYDLQVVGGAQRRLLVDGQPWSGPTFLGQGAHGIDVRWSVDSLAQAPLQVTASFNGGAHQVLPASTVTHDVKSVRPVINSMQPSTGISTGGNHVVISGFGFFTPAQVKVHWGSQILTLAQLLLCESDRIELLSPPGSGAVDVRVETPRGLSNKKIFTYQTQGPPPIVFNAGPVISIQQPTAAAWGPDHRLYVVSRNGELKVITFDAAYNPTSVSTHPGVSGTPAREALGIAFSPYDAPSPVRAFVSHTTLFAHGGGSFSGPSPYPGRVSTLVGPGFGQPSPLILGLPTSNHDHGVNAMEFDHNGDLLIAMGGNTNAGVKWWKAGDLPESPLSGALLRARTSGPSFQGALSYVETATGQVNNDQVHGEIVDLVPGTSVETFATGLRNCFDFTLTTWGLLYATDNGPNSTYGPASTGPSSQTSWHPSDQDELLIVEEGRYYGHPNRNRGRSNAVENVYHDSSHGPAPGFTPSIATLPPSSNGIVEYRSAVFGGQMRGELLVMKFNEQLRRVRLSTDKRSVQSIQVLPVWMNGLGVVAGPGGALLSLDYSNNALRVFLPQDSSATTATVHDITPWRAPSGGGTPFVLGGVHFGNLSNTTVRIGGVLAQLTSVSPTRIHGIYPAQGSLSPDLVDVQVTVGSQSSLLQGAVRYLPPSPGGHASASGGSGGWTGSWRPGPPMPVALGEVACAAIGGRIYVVGEGSSQTLSFDTATRQWSTSHPARPHPGHHHAAESLDGKWYLIGGLGGGEGKVQIFDTATSSWSLGADMPWAGGSVSTCRIGGRIYAAGGIVGGTTVDHCAAYDIGTNTWIPLAPMPFQKGRNHAAAGTDGTRLWIFGGRGIGSGAGNTVANGFADVQVYDPASDTWTASYMPGSGLSPLPIGRGGMGKAVFHLGEFLIFGGETLNGPGAVAGNVYDRVDVYDVGTNTWRLATPMRTPRHGIFPVVHRGRIFVPGGGVVAGFSTTSVMDAFGR